MHHAHGAVNWGIVKYLVPGVILGTLAGSTLAGSLSTQALGIIFVIFIYYAATQMWFNLRPSSTRALPGTVGMVVAGGVIGALSSLVAIGGGILTVPSLPCAMSSFSTDRTAAAVGFPIAAAGALGYILNGMAQTQPLPEYSLGYVYPPALGWIVASMLTAPLGAYTTHRMQTTTLKKIFVVCFICWAPKLLNLF